MLDFPVTPPRGLVLPPLSVRIRQRAPGPQGALVTRRDFFLPEELLFSEVAEDYIAGRVKIVINSVELRRASIDLSSSIVKVPVSEHSLYAQKHRENIATSLAEHYRLAVMRAAFDKQARSSKGRKRARNTFNRKIGALRDKGFSAVGAVQKAFERHPDALEFAAEILDLHSQIERLQ